MIPGKTESAVWAYFGFFPDKDGKPQDLQKPVCKKCCSTVATKGSNTTNLLQPLKLHHPVIYKSVKEVHSANESTMSKFQLYPCSSKKWQKLTDAVTYCVAKDMMPLRCVEKIGFKHMLHTFDPHT